MNSKHMSKYREIGNRIAQFRQEKNLSQQQLADMVGISKSYLSKIEAPCSKKTYSLEVLFDISNVLGINMQYLFTDID